MSSLQKIKIVVTFVFDVAAIADAVVAVILSLLLLVDTIATVVVSVLYSVVAFLRLHSKGKHIFAL